MLSRIKSLFNSKILEKSGQENPDTPAMNIAACAILLEMARVDGEFSSEEKETVISILKSYLSLTEAEVKELLDVSADKLSKSTDMWEFSHCVNEQLPYKEKVYLMELIWKVVYSDNSLDKHEDYFVHKLQKLLNIQHKDMIAAKLKVKREVGLRD